MARRLPPVSTCLNCGTPVSSSYCPDCGQEAVQHTASVPVLLADLANEIFSLDSKLLRTLLALLFKPGRLTVAYTHGQRVRYLSPVRVYLTCSLVFFLLVLWAHSRVVAITSSSTTSSASGATAKPKLAGGQSVTTSANTEKSPAAVSQPAAPEKTKNRLNFTAGRRTISSFESIPDTVDEFNRAFSTDNKKLSPTDVYIITQIIKMKKLGKEGIIRKYLENFPNMMFLLLPIFAVALKMLYIRSELKYVEHLVFLLHAHAFAYIVLSILLLLPQNPILSLIPLGIPVYVFLAMRTFYRQPWWKTSIKLGMLFVGYATIFAICLVGTFAVTFLTA